VQKQPHRNAERAGEMRGHRVDGDDEIERAHQTRRADWRLTLGANAKSSALVRMQFALQRV